MDDKVTDEELDDNESLMPCPHCGSPARYGKDGGGWEWIECEKCGACTNRSASLMEDCHSLLREAWNSRQAQEAPKAEACQDCVGPCISPKCGPPAWEGKVYPAQRAASQSAEELRRYALDTTKGEVFEIAKGAYCLFDDVQKTFAAQRQAGREEAEQDLIEARRAFHRLGIARDEQAKHYAAVVEALKETIEWMEINEEMAGFGNPPLRIKARKALSDLDEAT